MNFLEGQRFTHTLFVGVILIGFIWSAFSWADEGWLAGILLTYLRIAVLLYVTILFRHLLTNLHSGQRKKEQGIEILKGIGLGLGVGILWLPLLVLLLYLFFDKFRLRPLHT